MKKVLIINGHPDKESLCHELAQSYKRGADKSEADCKVVNLIDLDFDPILRWGYRIKTELEPDLKMVQQEILAADHLVFVYPIWWGTYPALLKGFFDRTFLPSFAFKYREGSLLWDKLLKGKTARIITTMDAPKWYYRLIAKRPGITSVKKGVLEFCGVKPVRTTSFAPIKTADKSKLLVWIKKVEDLGKELS